MYNTKLWEGMLLIGPFVLVGLYFIIVRYALNITGPLTMVHIKWLIYAMILYLTFVLFVVRKEGK